MTQLVGIPPGNIDQVWPLVEKHITDALNYNGGGRFTADDLKERMQPDPFGNAALQLWLAWDGSVRAVAVTEIKAYPNGRREAVVLVLTGSARKTWLNHLSHLKAWAKAQGCFWFSGIARPGWERVLKNEMKKTHVFLETRL